MFALYAEDILFRLTEIRFKQEDWCVLLPDELFYQTVNNLFGIAEQTILIQGYVYSMGKWSSVSRMWALSDQLRQKAREGVRVEILVSQSGVGQNSRRGFRKAQEFFKNSGVVIRMLKSVRVYHAKYLIVDGWVGIVGSHNFQEKSLRNNDELSIMIKSKSVSDRLVDRFMKTRRLT